MDIQHIQDMVSLVAHSQLAEVEITVQGDSIRIKNSQYATLHNNQLSRSNVKDTAKQDVDEVTNDNTYVIKSTYIGRLKLSADAISEPLVKVGDKVQQGDTVAYVACMAQLLPVIADKAGCVYSILLEDNDKVEYGTPIIKLPIKSN